MHCVIFCAYLACVPLANWMIGHVGSECIPQGPCLLPVAPGLMAPSGVIVIGAALVLRDIVQRTLGIMWGLVAVLIGVAVSWGVAAPNIALASATAFMLSELADFAVFTPLQRRGLIAAVVASSMVGLIIDSGVFLWLAFGSLDFIGGQIVGKAWAVLFSIPVIAGSRRLMETSV